MATGRKVLMVTLNLKGPSARYAPLYDLLKAEAGWAHYLGQAWFVWSPKTPKELSAEIAPLTLKGDFFLVARLGEHWGFAPRKLWDWLKRHPNED
jgi:hypothetical protein